MTLTFQQVIGRQDWERLGLFAFAFGATTLSDTPKHVLFVEPGELGGGSFESMYEMVRNLDPRRYRASVLFFNPNRYEALLDAISIPHYRLIDPQVSVKARKASRFFWARATLLIAYRLPSLSLAWMRFSHQRTIKAMARLCVERQVDLLHLNNQPDRHFFGFLAAKRAGLPCISHIRSLNMDGFTRDKAIYANAVCYRFIAYFGDIRDKWIRAGIAPDKTEVLRNCITPFRSNALDLHSYYGIPGHKKFIFGSIGQMNYYRGYDLLVNACKHVFEQAPDAHCVIAGADDAGMRKSLEQMSIDLGIRDNITFTDFEQRAREVLAGLDTVVLPYRQSPYGRILLEAWCLEKAIVASDMPPIRDIIHEYKNGILVPPEDPLSLANALLRLRETPQLRHVIGQGGRKTVEEDLSMTRYMEKIQEIYDHACEIKSSE